MDKMKMKISQLIIFLYRKMGTSMLVLKCKTLADLITFDRTYFSTRSIFLNFAKSSVFPMFKGVK